VTREPNFVVISTRLVSRFSLSFRSTTRRGMIVHVVQYLRILTPQIGTAWSCWWRAVKKSVMTPETRC